MARQQHPPVAPPPAPADIVGQQRPHLAARAPQPAAVADCEPAVMADEKGATLGPWIQAFREQMKRHWYVSYDAAGKKGRLTVSFRVAKDGVIDNVSLTDASPVNAHNDSMLRAIVAMSPAAPEAYPAQYAVHGLLHRRAPLSAAVAPLTGAVRDFGHYEGRAIRRCACITDPWCDWGEAEQDRIDGGSKGDVGVRRRARNHLRRASSVESHPDGARGLMHRERAGRQGGTRWVWTAWNW